MSASIPTTSSVASSPKAMPGRPAKPLISVVEGDHRPNALIRWTRSISSWGVSIVVHMVLLIIMGLWVTEVHHNMVGDLMLTLEPPSEDPSELRELSAPTTLTTPTETAAAAASFEPASVTLPQELPDTSAVATNAAATSQVDLATTSSVLDRQSLERVVRAPEVATAGGENPRRSAIDGGVVEAQDVGGAAKGVLGGLEGELADGDVYLVWLLDASVSLYEDRQKLAESITPFYEEMAARDGRTQTQVHTAVVAYGSVPLEVAASTKFSSKTIEAVRRAPVDPSGIENVMTAIQFCVEKYRNKARGRMRIVLWTDESGDDTQMLEETIARCREIKAVVHVVGPSSVLGSNRGLQTYVDAGTQFKFLLPVTRGPDACLPERIMLPYWYDTSTAAGDLNGATIADGMPWYGGALRERLLSGVGPYALTRLALETGGTFTLLDRPQDRSPFRLETMKPYFPDYGTVKDVMYEIEQNPLRHATWKSVMTTYQPVNLAAPKFEFYAYRQPTYPFRLVGAEYRSPEEFRKLLLPDLAQQVQHVAAAMQAIGQAISHFDQDRDWETDYRYEKEPRWKAWYDLTHGRLLALSVRHQEYLAACQWLLTAGNLGPQINHVVFSPTETLRLKEDPQVIARAEQAKKLLLRCKESNVGTPWELLAQWELEMGLGVEVKQDVIPVPGPSVPVPPPPKIVLPNL